MKAVQVSECGPPEVLRVQQVKDPSPSEGEVLIAVEVAGVSYGDIVVRSGRYPFPKPYVPGLEAGGRVVAVGAGADRSLVGKRVVAATVGMTGGYAELALAEAANTYEVPAGPTLERAVAVFQAGALAIGLVSAMRVRPGDSVLVTAAAGRIGSLLVQRARAAGATTVIAAVGNPQKAVAAAGFGADTVVDYTAPDWVKKVREATGGKGADVVVDAIGGDIATQALEATADGGGRFGLYGFTSGTWLPLDAHQIGRRGITVVGALGITFAKPVEEQRADAAEALRAAAAGQLVPRIHGTFPLDRAADAHRAVESRDSIGAVLIRP
ncbi:zinc-binding dehydrogenase [Streptomyces sp. NBC_01198]|uniref:zinc-binding dehydrogenase n=1 Tax=Streptomyces sp. NBC_01198 TaxID=2903769 RepID=UPI002E122F9B|nr:zinc-binding dehydrogenase [Streptomyces sp. NBC_01198]